MSPSDEHQTLQTVQSNIDDIRSIASCKICLRPSYEPFMLTCGHSFCYGCLRSWVCGGDNRKRKHNCPECRASIKQQPSPNYALRNLAHIFTDRPELLPQDETLEDHKTAKAAEANLLADDRNGQGLFKNVFKFSRFSEPLEGIWDPLDAVHRCPNCNWELEDGVCNSCGFDNGRNNPNEDESDLDLDEDSYSDGSWPASDVLVPMDERAARGMSPRPHRAYDMTDESDTNSEAETIPFGYRDYMHLHRHLDGHGDEDEDEGDDFDNNDDIDGFIDDGEYPDEIGFDSDSDEDEDTDQSQEPQHQPRHPLRLSRLISRRSGRSHPGRVHIAGLGDDDSIRQTSSHAPSGSDSEGTARPPDFNISEDDDQQTNYDESSEDGSIHMMIMPQPNQNRRRRLVICDEEDDDSDNGDESEEEAISTQVMFGDSESASGVDIDDDHDDEDDEDEDEDEDVFSSSRTARMQRSQRLTNENTRQDRLRQIRTGVANDPLSRNQRRGRSTRHTSTHGYHPYARQNGSDRSNGRHSNPASRSRGNSRTASVH